MRGTRNELMILEDEKFQDEVEKNPKGNFIVGKLHGRWVPARVILAILSFFGFFTNFMMRVNLNIAIVEMASITSQEDVNLTIGEGECYNNDLENHTEARQRTGEFEWSVQQQGLILGSFYWSYILTQLPGALLTHKLGTKFVFGGANLVCSLAALLIPVAVRRHYIGLVAVRIIQGIVSGTMWPSMNVMVSTWIPPHERSKFVTTYYGNTVGLAVTYPLCGVLIDQLGWEYAFYVPGVLGLVWCLFWWLLVFDSPAAHPYITCEEKRMIQEQVGPHLSRSKPPVPWKHMVTSIPLWALIISNVASMWVFYVVLTYSPTYFKYVHGFGIRMNGLLSGLPNMCRFIVSIVFSWLVDHLLQSKALTLTSVRKLATAAGELIPAALCLLVTNMGCSSTAEVIVIVLIAGIGGCESAGPLANSLDLAPNFSGVVLALVSMVSMASGFVVPAVVSILTEHQPASFAPWRTVFCIASGILFFCCSVYLAFGSGEVQPWNSPSTRKKESGGTDEEKPLSQHTEKQSKNNTTQ